MQLAAKRLDLSRIDALLARGFDPNTSIGGQRNTVLNIALETCEWNPGNEQRVLMVARALIDAGAKVDQRNYCGDTAYSIASARRYCGPDHPATKLMRLWCSDGAGGVRPSCLARYMSTKGSRRPRSPDRASARLP